MDIIEKLKRLGFTESMAMVYIELLKNPGYNGTQIFKELNIPRSSVYKALDDLLNENMIVLIPSNENLKNYNPVAPNELMSKLNLMYEDIFKTIGMELLMIYKPSDFSEVFNIKGSHNVYYKINEMIKNAKDSIIISGEIDYEKLLVEFDKSILINRASNNYERYVLVDNKEIIIFSLEDDYLTAIYTKNSLILNKYINE